MTPRSPVPPEVSTELDRVVLRWRQLPLEVAQDRVPAVRALVDELAAGQGEAVVPDLGPAVLMDQLTVLAYDACRDGRVEADELGRRLADLRRALA